MVNNMKKVLIILGIIIIMLCFSTPKVEPVVLMEQPIFNVDEYNLFDLDLTLEDISTLDLKEIINNDMDVISISLRVNPLYKDVVGELKYKYQNVSLNKNISNINKYYVDSIRDKGFMENFDYISVTGIKIDGIEVFCKGSDIVELIYKYKNIRYKDYLNNSYNYLKF